MLIVKFINFFCNKFFFWNRGLADFINRALLWSGPSGIRIISNIVFSNKIAGIKVSLWRPSLYNSSGWKFDVMTNDTLNSFRYLKSDSNIIAWAISCTWNSSKQIRSYSRASFFEIFIRGSLWPFKRTRSSWMFCINSCKWILNFLFIGRDV